jgi:hypothetical protein
MHRKHVYMLASDGWQHHSLGQFHMRKLSPRDRAPLDPGFKSVSTTNCCVNFLDISGIKSHLQSPVMK